MATITRFITTKLKLKVNERKSAVARPWERKFLGFSFTCHSEPKRRIAPNAVDHFKERVRELTSRTRRVSTESSGGRTGRISMALDRLFWKVRNAFSVAKPGGVDQTQASVCVLEAVQMRFGAIY